MTMKKPMGFSKSNSKREVYSNTIIPQEIRKALKRQPNSTSKAVGEKKFKKPKVSKRNEIIKIRVEVHEKEMKKQEQRVIKLKAGPLRQ